MKCVFLFGKKIGCLRECLTSLHISGILVENQEDFRARVSWLRTICCAHPAAWPKRGHFVGDVFLWGGWLQSTAWLIVVLRLCMRAGKPWNGLFPPGPCFPDLMSRTSSACIAQVHCNVFKNSTCLYLKWWVCVQGPHCCAWVCVYVYMCLYIFIFCVDKCQFVCTYFIFLCSWIPDYPWQLYVWICQ